MRSKTLQRILDKTPKDTEIFVDRYFDLMIKIGGILKEQGYSRKMVTENPDEIPSEIYKWLTGNNDFSLRSIVKLEIELGINLLEVCK